jgi:hypothetical protein
MSKSILNAQAAAAAFILGLAAPQALAADSGQLYYPPGPPAIDSALYAPASMVTGDISVAGGWWSGYEAAEVLAAGRVNVPLQGGPWNLTGELFGTALFVDPTFTEFLGAAHLYRKTDQYAHGVYASATGFAEGGLSGHEIGLGVEGAAFMGNTTLVGRLGHNWGDGYGYWSAEGILRYYINPNTKLAALVGWAGGSSSNEWMLAGGIEHLFSGTNMTGFARIARFTDGSDGVWELTGGARFFFHRPGGTLQQHDWDIPFAEATVVNF